MKTKLISMMCFMLLLTGCAQADGGSAPRSSDTENAQIGNSEPSSSSAANSDSSSIDANEGSSADDTDSASTDPKIDGSSDDTSANDAVSRAFPPEEKTAPVTLIPNTSTPPRDSDGSLLPGFYNLQKFELDGIEYCESTFSDVFVIDDGEIVQLPYEESVDSNDIADKLPDAISKLFSLEYLGVLTYPTTGYEEYLFCYENYVLAVANDPEAKENVVDFKDSGYDESQFYGAHFFVPDND